MMDDERCIKFLEAFQSEIQERHSQAGGGEPSLAGFRSLLDHHMQVESSSSLRELSKVLRDWQLEHQDGELPEFMADLLTHVRALKAAADAEGHGLFGKNLKQMDAEELEHRVAYLARVLRERKAKLRAAARRTSPTGPRDGERASAAETKAKTARVKEALAWWRTEGLHYDNAEWVRDYVRIHRDRILFQEAEIRRAFEADDDLCSTHEKCVALAEWAVAKIPKEIAFQLPGADAALLARVLRQHFGHRREVLLPAALTPIPAPTLVLSPLEEILAELPESARDGIARDIKAAMNKDQVTGICKRVIALRKEQLDAQGVPEDEQRDRLNALEFNLRRAAERPSRREGLV